VRLSPKSIFFGIISLGLPFAVTVGWILGAPVVNPVAAASAPVGAGGLGAAPSRGSTSRPVTVVEFASHPAKPAASVSAVPPSVAPRSAPPSAKPVISVSTSVPPVLTLPPVPTPTEIVSPPDSPSATPSGSASPEASGVDGAQLVRRP
jgi:hypothetical protein